MKCIILLRIIFLSTFLTTLGRKLDEHKVPRLKAVWTASTDVSVLMVEQRECNKNCAAGGTCSRDGLCVCFRQFRTGEYCTQEADNCKDDFLGVCNPEHTRACTSYWGYRMCHCESGWTGLLCERPVAPAERHSSGAPGYVTLNYPLHVKPTEEVEVEIYGSNLNRFMVVQVDVDGWFYNIEGHSFRKYRKPKNGSGQFLHRFVGIH